MRRNKYRFDISLFRFGDTIDTFVDDGWFTHESTWHQKRGSEVHCIWLVCVSWEIDFRVALLTVL